VLRLKNPKIPELHVFDKDGHPGFGRMGVQRVDNKNCPVRPVTHSDQFYGIFSTVTWSGWFYHLKSSAGAEFYNMDALRKSTRVGHHIVSAPLCGPCVLHYTVLGLPDQELRQVGSSSCHTL
jgi:hypothetical protein